MGVSHNMKSLKNDNRGLSLTEVVVVVGILVILAASTASAMGYLVRGNIKEATKTLYSAIASNQTYAKAKSGEWTFKCEKIGQQFVLTSTCTYTDPSGTVSVDDYETQYLSDRVNTVKVKDSLAPDYTDLLSIQFQKNTGAVLQINGAAVPKAGYADIQVEISGNIATLRLYYLTGEIEMY